MSTYRYEKIIAGLFLYSCLSHGMSFDNRFIPLLARPFITVENRPSHMMLDVFFITASKALATTGEEIGIPELYGFYNQHDVAQGLVAIGQPNPLPSEYQGMTLPWITQGRIQGQGAVWRYEQYLASCFSIGMSWYLMVLNSHPDFFLKTSEINGLTQDQFHQLDVLRREMNVDLGLTSQHAYEVGMGDIDAYLRMWGEWCYPWKFRHVQAGFNIGLLAPVGQGQNINIPASIPFGGNCHWGAYISGDAEFEIKEDWKFDILLRLNKRFALTNIQRMPVNKEPYVYGPVVGLARVNPGFTFVFLPSFLVENLREGLAARVLYTLVVHGQDSWCDERACKVPAVNLKQVSERSAWAADYVTINVLYDFGKIKVKRCFEPIVSLAWDIPVSLIVGKSYCKTNRISLGVEFAF